MHRLVYILLSEAGFQPAGGFVVNLSTGWTVRASGGPELLLTPRDDHRPHYLQTATLNLSYRAERDLSRCEKQIAVALQTALKRIETQRPEALTAICALLFAQSTPGPATGTSAPPSSVKTPAGETPVVETRAKMEKPAKHESSPPRPRVAPPDRLLRLTTVCNQRCPFCNTNLSAPDFARSPQAIAQRLQKLAAQKTMEVCFTGGEPTLVDKLCDHIAQAAAYGFAVALQTNAVKLADAAYTAQLKAAGLGRVLISLHAAQESRSARLTGVTGDLEKTLAGIRAAHAAGLTVATNTVICKPNCDTLVDLVDLFDRDHGPLAGCVAQMVFSFMAPVARGKRNCELMARIRDVRPHLENALELAHKNALCPTIPTLCGAPLCALGPRAARFSAELTAPVRGSPAPAAPPAPDRTYLASCGECRYRDRCTGIWKLYLRTYGKDEFRPLRNAIRPLILPPAKDRTLHTQPNDPSL